ncbi:MAG: hypothetical protein QE285_12680 [Aquabacterium sp.]|nr:hypothetical protein [Aquabacterium sp.]
MKRLFTVTTAGLCDLATRRSGELPISPKLLARLCTPAGRLMVLMADGVTAGPVAVPPKVPAVVRPFTVPAGWVGSVRL